MAYSPARTQRSVMLDMAQADKVDAPQADAWRERAACRGLDARIFYPVTEEEERAAQAVCEICEVRIDCLEWALERREKDGIWGGATERDRRRIIRQRRRTARLARTA